MTHFTKKISHWYHQHHRALPWRETSDPYRIWISEIILQQTQVKQGLDYYLKFIKTFPDIKALATASEQNVLKTWQGLGYYSRARNLHKAAQYVYYNLNGVFPTTKQDLQKLKGIGPYTAAAIASIAFNEPHAVVDGNVYRLLSRFFAIDTPIDTTAGKKEFERFANELLDKQNPGIFNQAMMEMGALICTPVNPRCSDCPLIKNCISAKAGTQKKFPVKRKKTEKRTRFFNYIVLKSSKTIYLSKREDSDIWQGLYEPLLIESKHPLKQQEVVAALKTMWPGLSFRVISEYHKRHLLTHQLIEATFFGIVLHHDEELPPSTGKSQLVPVLLNEMDNYPVPRLIEKYLHNHFLPSFEKPAEVL